jgi:hypothetical protein
MEEGRGGQAGKPVLLHGVDDMDGERENQPVSGSSKTRPIQEKQNEWPDLSARVLFYRKYCRTRASAVSVLRGCSWVS